MAHFLHRSWVKTNDLSSSISSAYQNVIYWPNSIQCFTETQKGPKISHIIQINMYFYLFTICNFISANFSLHFITKYRIKRQIFQTPFSQRRGHIKLYTKVDMRCLWHRNWIDLVNSSLKWAYTSWNWPNVHDAWLCTSWSSCHTLLSSRTNNIQTHK